MLSILIWLPAAAALIGAIAGGERTSGAVTLLGSLGGYRPVARERSVSAALQVYAALATSASTGASRDISALARLAPETQ